MLEDTRPRSLFLSGGVPSFCSRRCVTERTVKGWLCTSFSRHWLSPLRRPSLTFPLSGPPLTGLPHEWCRTSRPRLMHYFPMDVHCSIRERFIIFTASNTRCCGFGPHCRPTLYRLVPFSYCGTCPASCSSSVNNTHSRTTHFPRTRSHFYFSHSGGL